MTRVQIVWLKIDCPFDGSVKALCKSFFFAVDAILGTDYFLKFGKDSISAATMMIHMSYVASLHGIGLIIIDELQHLIKTKKEISKEMLNFFVTLINIIGVPLVLIGTYKALDILATEFRQARRIGSEGDVRWNRMIEDDEWDFFLERLWSFQWLKVETPLTEELKKVIYEESQGITAVAVNLFMLAQARALYTTDEIITKKLIHDTAKQELGMIQKMLEAIRTNLIKELSKYEDISVDVEKVMGNMLEKLDVRKRVDELAQEKKNAIDQGRSNVKENIYADLKISGIFSELNDVELEEIAQKVANSFEISEAYQKIKQEAYKIALAKNQQKEDDKVAKEVKRIPSIGKNDLRMIFNKAKRQQVYIYDLLKEKGYIKHPVDELFFGELA